ncbi:MAG: hypothetical protein ACLQVF_28680 [Isosphaeraceae bacterium]
MTLVPEDDLRAALRPYRVDPGTFESAVRARVSDSLSHADDSLASLSPVERSAAAFLPLEVIAAGQMPAASFKLIPGIGGYKLLSYVAFPAISLFVLLGATVFSILEIRRIRDENSLAPVDGKVLRESTKQWWHDNKWGVWSVFAASVTMVWFGATWLLFLCYIVSVGLLIFVLTSLARIGLGNRLVVCQSCVMSLGFLGQLAGFPGIGDEDIHVVDQLLIAPLFFCGALVVTLIMVGSSLASHRRAGGWGEKTRAIVPAVAFAVFLAPLTVWYMNPILWPATPSRIKAYVASFDSAPFSTASWQQWEIVASWAVESKLDPDLSHPRQLLDAEIAGEQNPVILGSAFRVGLVRTDQLGRLKDYEQRRHILFDRPIRMLEARPLTSLDTDEWVIRAAIMRHDLTAEQRDYLEKRLHATLEAVSTGPYAVLKTPLRATQLLEVIERPVNPDRYRHKIHDLLRTFHIKKGGGFQVGGGFKDYNQENIRVGSLEATSFAVKLMESYGIPAELDPNWVRSYLRPLFVRSSPQKFMAAVTLDRLNRLPDVTGPTWLETMYYERSLLAAVVLIGLCIYAALSSPMPRAVGTDAGSPPPE